MTRFEASMPAIEPSMAHFEASMPGIEPSIAHFEASMPGIEPSIARVEASMLAIECRELPSWNRRGGAERRGGWSRIDENSERPPRPSGTPPVPGGECSSRHVESPITRVESLIGLMSGRTQADVLVTCLIWHVLHDQLKHLVRNSHASVSADNFLGRRIRVVGIVRGIVVHADGRDG
jgi:hypothetical protein